MKENTQRVHVLLNVALVQRLSIFRSQAKENLMDIRFHSVKLILFKITLNAIFDLNFTILLIISLQDMLLLN